MQDFRNLKVWQNSHKLTLEVYRHTESFPKSEVFGLTSQLRRASSSIAANIVEGSARGSDMEFGRYLQIAMGSASETEYHLLLAHDLGYLDDTSYDSLQADIVEVKQMLASLIKKVKADGNRLKTDG